MPATDVMLPEDASLAPHRATAMTTKHADGSQFRWVPKGDVEVDPTTMGGISGTIDLDLRQLVDLSKRAVDFDALYVGPRPSC